MENLIEEALTATGLESYYLYRPNELKECIVHSYTYKSALWADNECKANEYTILLNAYIGLDKSISSVREKIIQAMEGKGFKLQPVPTPQRLKDHINIALMFKIIK